MKVLLVILAIITLSSAAISTYVSSDNYYVQPIDACKCPKMEDSGCGCDEGRLYSQWTHSCHKPKSISGCSDYEFYNNTDETYCTGCKSGYYMSRFNKCQKNPKEGETSYVENCSDYSYQKIKTGVSGSYTNDPSQVILICDDCKDDFMLVETESATVNTLYSCTAVPKTGEEGFVDNCTFTKKTIPSSGTTDSTYYCGCNEGYYEPSTALNTCAAFDTATITWPTSLSNAGFITNALCYQTDDTTNFEIFECYGQEQCASGFVYNYNLDFCLDYKAAANSEVSGWTSNCIDYNSSTFKCSECENGFYLKDDTCIVNPSFVTNCVSYESDDSYNQNSGIICNGCDEGYELSVTNWAKDLNTIDYTIGCVENDQNKVSNCEQYSDSYNTRKQCSGCKDGYEGVYDDDYIIRKCIKCRKNHKTSSGSNASILSVSLLLVTIVFAIL